MKHFFIIVNKQKDKKLEVSTHVSNYLKSKGAVCSIFDEYVNEETTSIAIPEGTECILAIGGDGTILNAAGQLVGTNIPMLGINLGTLGFLADINHAEIEDALDCLIKDDFQVENRVMIEGKVYRDGKCVNKYIALNDFVIRKKSPSGTMKLRIDINGTEIQSYQADGLLVSTPTGSTGYNLSAGGPIINPTCKNYVVTPICPHSLTARSVVLSVNDCITIHLEAIRATDKDDGLLLYDGKDGGSLCLGDEIKIYRADEVTPFVKLKEVSFVKILKEKLY